jgi:NAD(P)-dependent dehydrogenase (short-subunit alcohol dehydrogenase family)
MGRGHPGKIAVITGAAVGIGRAFALRLAEEGVDIAIADRAKADDTARAITALGRKVFARVCDITNPDEVTSFATDVGKALGRCDILVNSAGIYPPQPFDDITFADWRRVMSVNLDAMFLLTKAFSPAMRKRGWGRIVNVASDTVSLTVPDFVHYIASKGGVIGFTRAIATEFAANGVTANVIAPGLTLTPGTQSRKVWFGGMSPEQFFPFAAEHNPMKRLGAPDDLAATLAFLTSDDASYITGQTLYVNGGLTRT